VRLKVSFDWSMKTLYDVVARIEGSTYPDEWVIFGNHHDAWVNGADDPTSGQVALMETGRAFGELLKQGWKPKRTIIMCAWDGEEEGLLGSTEWVETHADELTQKAVAYLNSDSTSKGRLGVGGSHSLERFINEVARDVEQPGGKGSVLDAMKERRNEQARSDEDKKEIKERADLRISALGSGSDYTPFLQHMGIASMNTGFGGEGGGGVYHSIYDSFDHYIRFGDPGFEYGVALVRTCGRVVLRLADADVLPYEFSNFADTLGKYVKEIAKLTDELREGTVETNRLISDKVLTALADPKQPFVTPNPKPEVPYLNFAPLHNALAALQRSADRFEAARTEARTMGRTSSSYRPGRGATRSRPPRWARSGRAPITALASSRPWIRSASGISGADRTATACGSIISSGRGHRSSREGTQRATRVPWRRAIALPRPCTEFRAREPLLNSAPAALCGCAGTEAPASHGCTAKASPWLPPTPRARARRGTRARSVAPARGFRPPRTPASRTANSAAPPRASVRA
jgi:hypothetical protein